MGLPPDRRIEGSTQTLPLDDNPRERDLVDRALESNIELRQSEYERRAREHLVSGQIMTKWPSVDLVGEYALWGKFNNFQEFFNRFQRNNFNIGLQVRIPLISSQRSANIALARSELSAADMELRSKRQTVELQVSQQYQRFRELNAGREVARLELQLAQESLQVIQASFQEGRGNLRDVERARLDESDKWVAFLDIDYDRQKSQLELLNMTGDLGRLLQ